MRSHKDGRSATTAHERATRRGILKSAIYESLSFAISEYQFFIRNIYIYIYIYIYMYIHVHARELLIINIINDILQVSVFQNIN